MSVDAREFIYTIPESILFDNDMQSSDLRVYMLIRSFNDCHKEMFGSNSWIAQKCGLERRYVIKVINRLEAKGYIERKLKNGRRILFTKIAGCLDDLVSCETPPRVLEDTPPRVLEDTHTIAKDNNLNIIKHSTPTVRKNYSKYKETLFPLPDPTPQPLKTVISDNPHNIPPNLLDEYQQLKKAKRSPITATVWKLLNDELSKCKDPISAFEEMISRGWNTFKAAWIEQSDKKKEVDWDSMDWAKPQVFKL